MPRARLFSPESRTSRSRRMMIQLLAAACVSIVLITGLYCVVNSGSNGVASLNSNTQNAIHIFQSLPDTPSQKKPHGCHDQHSQHAR
mmetsp:Transcript_13654/g.15671  ORF Transcript_13654/g.15671 Transcript_13654/m.15671 type:complete len:87 (-) Transcript_13654:21-281(-)